MASTGEKPSSTAHSPNEETIRKSCFLSAHLELAKRLFGDEFSAHGVPPVLFDRATITAKS